MGTKEIFVGYEKGDLLAFAKEIVVEQDRWKEPDHPLKHLLQWWQIGKDNYDFSKETHPEWNRRMHELFAIIPEMDVSETDTVFVSALNNVISYDAYMEIGEYLYSLAVRYLAGRQYENRDQFPETPKEWYQYKEANEKRAEAVAKLEQIQDIVFDGKAGAMKQAWKRFIEQEE